MHAQLIFAFIWNEKVMNVAVCEDYHSANELAKMCYDDTAIAVQCNQVSCHINDVYRDGAFYTVKNGEEVVIQPLPTEADEIQTIKCDNEITASELTSMQLAIVEMYELSAAAIPAIPDESPKSRTTPVPAIAKVYATLVLKGLKTIDGIPRNPHDLPEIVSELIEKITSGG